MQAKWQTKAPEINPNNPDWVEGFNAGQKAAQLTRFLSPPMNRGHEYLAGWLSGAFTSKPVSLQIN